MAGKKLTFVNTSNVYEAWFAIYGPIHAEDSSYSLNAYTSVTFLSDGTRWWIIGEYS